MNERLLRNLQNQAIRQEANRICRVHSLKGHKYKVTNSKIAHAVRDCNCPHCRKIIASVVDEKSKGEK